MTLRDRWHALEARVMGDTPELRAITAQHLLRLMMPLRLACTVALITSGTVGGLRWALWLALILMAISMELEAALLQRIVADQRILRQALTTFMEAVIERERYVALRDYPVNPDSKAS